MNEFVLGIDIGGSNTEFAYVDRKGNCLEKECIPTHLHECNNQNPNDLLERIQLKLKQFQTKGKALGIGIGAPNANFYTGNVEHAPNLKWAKIVPLVQLTKQRFGLPVAMTNDANAAALGEKIFGAAKNMSNFIVVSIGTGLGGGFFANGNLLHGHNGLAGEVGHILIDKNGRACACGKKGCLESYVSANGLKQSTLKFLTESTQESELHKIPFQNFTAKIIAEAAKKGDVIAIKSFEYTAEILGKTLADLTAIIDPEAIFVCGGLACSGKVLFDPLQKSFHKNLMPVFQNRVQILASGIKTNNVGVLGAAALIWDILNQKNNRSLLPD